MSYQEAIKDGIKICKNRYYPKCYMCGEETMSLSYIPKFKYTCSLCKLEKKKEEQGLRKQLNELTKENKLEKAISVISKKANISQYSKAIKIVHRNLNVSNYFESTEEILTALELLKNNIMIKHQVKINRYRVDFVLTDLKVILEVDGKHFHLKENRDKENARDSIISLSVGPSWEIIHISDDDLNNNITKLVPAIKSIIEQRKYIRSQYNGIIPEWYSDRNI